VSLTSLPVLMVMTRTRGSPSSIREQTRQLPALIRRPQQSLRCWGLAHSAAAEQDVDLAGSGKNTLLGLA
jgi:hypothetical protein